MSNLTPKPKVVAAVVGGIIASAILSNITLITPDLFNGLGKASGLVYGLTITLVIGICGWLKSDGESADTSAATPAKDATVPSPSVNVNTDVPDLDIPALAAALAKNAAQATTFPAAKVAAAEASVTVPEPVIAEPAPVAPVFEAPAEVAPVAPVA